MNCQVLPNNMRVQATADHIGCSKSHVWALVKQGKIKSYKISQRITIFKRNEVDAFLENVGVLS